VTTYAVVYQVRPPQAAAPPAAAVAVQAGAHGCTGTTKAGTACNGSAGPDGKCARHKET
jgi:hypothetical protein